MVDALNFRARLASLSSNARKHYALYTRRFLAHSLGKRKSEIDLDCLDGKVVLPILTRPNLTAYLGKLKQDGKHPGPIQQTRSAILLLAREFADLNLVGYELIEDLKQAAIPHTEAGQDPGIWLSPEQSRRMLVELYAQRSSCTPALQVEYTRALMVILIMFICGLRCNEVVQMHWQDFQKDGDNSVLRVHGKNSKLRIVKIPDSVARSLEDWRALCGAVAPATSIVRALQWRNQHLCVTTKGIGKTTVASIVRDAGELLGIPNLAPHDLRRTCARNAYLAGAPIELIRQMLGHESILTTQRYINAPVALDHTASDIVGESLDFFLEDEELAADSSAPRPDSTSLLTREESAKYLGLSVPQFDRLRRRKNIEPAETRPGKTRPFSLYRLSDIETLETRAS